MSERKLASIQRIEALEPIEGADRIIRATVLGWHVVVRKGEFNVGNECVYVEIDSVLPEKPEFEFMRERKFRVKTIKLRGQISQGICFPLSILPDGKKYSIGDDVTDVLGIKHYDDWHEDQSIKSDLSAMPKNPLREFLFRHKLTRWLGKKIFLKKKPDRIAFPFFLKKSDETRIQECPWLLQEGCTWYVTEKLDGSSATFFVRKNHGWKSIFEPYQFGVCSRNYQLPTPNDTPYWKVAKKYRIKDFLTDMIKEYDREWVCLQGEIVGPKIQCNPYHLTELRLYGFNLSLAGVEHPDNSRTTEKLNSISAKDITARFGLTWVPILASELVLPETVDEVISMAEGQSAIAPVPREGLVIRNFAGKSFKAVSNSYLLKNQDRDETPQK